MVVNIALPTLGTVVISAVVDSINPCAIVVLILLLSTLVAAAKSKAHMLKTAVVYISVIYTVYFLSGLGLIAFFANIPLIFTQIIGVSIGSIIAFFGLVEIKDFFWYGKGFSLTIPPEMAKRIHKYVEKLTLPGVIFLGIFVTGVELPCTGGPYLAITYVLSQNFNISALLLLAFYNLIFIAPLIAITALVATGLKVTDVQRWKLKYRPYMRLATGILLIYLAWLLILLANGTINLG